MPRISPFYGIVIAMFFDERTHPGQPHFPKCPYFPVAQTTWSAAGAFWRVMC
ncbi:MAG: hypothetical protein ACYCYK_00255 [Candidatus Dormibacteria bacterium]